MAIQPSNIVTAQRLREAVMLIDQHMPSGRDRDDVLRRLGLTIVGLERDEAAGLCRRCGRSFRYEATWYTERRLDWPRHCSGCRDARRKERARCGFPEIVRHARVQTAP